MNIRMKDIAKMASVSLITVSLVLNDSPSRISEEKKKEIKEIAKKYNYQPNAAAKSLAKNQSMTIGIIIPDIENPFFSKMTKYVEAFFREKGYLVMIMHSNKSNKNDRESMTKLISYGVDGILLTISDIKLSKKDIEFLENIKTPLVCIDRVLKSDQLSNVTFDNELGGYLATDFLIAEGHRNIGVLSGSMKSNTTIDRLTSYKKALKDNDITFNKNWLVESDFTFEGSYKVADELLFNPEISAIFSLKDMMALGLLKRANELGIQIPEDVSLVGYDNLDINQVVTPPLTTIHQDIPSLVELACRSLLEQIDGEEKKTQSLIAPSLIKRKSIKKIDTCSAPLKLDFWSNFRGALHLFGIKCFFICLILSQ